MVQIHSPRPTFSSRIIVLRWEFCSSCEFFCVLGSRFLNSLDATNLSPLNSLPYGEKFTSLRVPF